MKQYARILLWLASASACTSGCAVWNAPPAALPRAQALRPAPAAGLAQSTGQVSARAGSVQAPIDQGIANALSKNPGPPPAGGDQRAGSAMLAGHTATVTAPAGVDPKAFNDVIAQLESIGAIDPAKQARLLEDLKQTDPSLWPLMLEAFRASLAYHERIAGKAAGGSAGATVGTAGVLGQNGNEPRAGSAQGQASLSPTRQSPENGPWSALNVPAAGAAGAPLPKIAGRSAVATGAAELAARLPGRSAAGDVAATSPPENNHSKPLGEPVRFPVVESRHVPAAQSTPPQPAPVQATSGGNAQQAAGSTFAPGATQASPASTATDAGPSTDGGTPVPTPPVQQASYQLKLADNDFEGHLATAIRALESKTQKPPEGSDGVAAHAYLRMLYLVAGRREDALRPIAGIDPGEQDFWTKQMWSLATYLDSERTADAPRRAAEAAQHLSEAAGKLGEMGTLVVRNLAFCSEVRSYGVFTRFKDYEFKPGQRLLLYAEVENFKSDHTRKGYHTALKSSYQILDAQGRRVAGDESSPMEEYCQNPRRDYFLSYEHLSLPSPLYDGRYTLQLTIEDTLSQKIGQSSIEFTVLAK